MHTQVCELREKRLDQEEVLAEFQKAVEALKREKESLVKKDKVMDSALKQTEVLVCMHACMYVERVAGQEG